jgi:plastocyanin
VGEFHAISWNFRKISMFFVMSALLAGGAVGESSGAPKEGAKVEISGYGKYQVVRIDTDGISPRTLRVQKGTTVIWFNATSGYSSVVFNEGERILRSTRAPTLFYLAPDGTYLSAAFGPGAVASTAFVRNGTFNYFVTGIPISEGEAFARVTVE